MTPDNFFQPHKDDLFSSPDESQASPQAVEDFVDQELGLAVMQQFGSKSRGRRRSKPPLQFSMERALEVEDAFEMQNAPRREVGQEGGMVALQRIRTIHHQIARMLASGEKAVNISAILGVTPERVWQLKQDPTFAELLAHYEEHEEAAEISIKQRFYSLGTAGMETLQERLLDDPESFGNGHLMELVKLSVGGEAPRTATQTAGATTLSQAALEQLKKQADSQSRSSVAYRVEAPVEPESKPRSEGESSNG
ncbi:hypothetical protein [Idiomarina abyssalis]|uniref:hypothetical protein n=1 Tax=Idiomarina abyssalis TaxID=86102 RepID=UPI003A94B609